MSRCVNAHEFATLDLPFPRLAEGRFRSCAILTDEALFEATGVRIGFTQRLGGESAPPFDSLNLGLSVGDDSSLVARNRQTLFDSCGFGGVSIIQPKQVHGDAVVTCRSPKEYDSCARDAENGCDGVVVCCDDIAALLCFADCVPVVIVSPKGGFAVVHAGWRGVMSRIVRPAILSLCDADGVEPCSLNAYLGPHIRSCHFQVDSGLAARFASEFAEDVVVAERNVDLSKALKMTLLSCGVDAARIADSETCTVCDGGKRYYSYRASGGKCGRHGAFAVRGATHAKG